MNQFMKKRRFIQPILTDIDSIGLGIVFTKNVTNHISINNEVDIETGDICKDAGYAAETLPGDGVPNGYLFSLTGTKSASTEQTLTFINRRLQPSPMFTEVLKSSYCIPPPQGVFYLLR